MEFSASVLQILALVGLTLSGLVHAYPGPEAEDSVLHGHPMIPKDLPDDVTFTGPYKTGGEWVNLTGTIEQVYAQLLELNPDYDSEPFDEFAPQREAQEKVRRARDLERRAHTVYCDQPHGDYAPGSVIPGTNGISEGYNRLLSTQGYCYAPRGPSGCYRHACSWNAGITMCNDWSGGSIQKWCPWLGEMARDIESECAMDNGDFFWSVKGQAFTPNQWNVFVRWENC